MFTAGKQPTNLHKGTREGEKRDVTVIGLNYKSPVRSQSGAFWLGGQFEPRTKLKKKNTLNLSEEELAENTNLL